MQQPRYVVLDKVVGETPLACLERYRAEHPELADLSLAYAGRLDPLASGKLLVLIGDECKAQQRYHAFDKAYSVNLLVGAGTDSGDVLGLVEEDETRAAGVGYREIRATAQSLVGPLALPYPIYSSKPVAGKPLHTWAAEGRLAEIEVPIAHTYCYRFGVTTTHLWSRDEVYAAATAKIHTFPVQPPEPTGRGNDFRRPEILERWEQFRIAGRSADRFTVAEATLIVSSGTYVRAIVPELGRRLDTCALALSIHRTHIGRYRKLGPLGLWHPRLS